MVRSEAGLRRSLQSRVAVDFAGRIIRGVGRVVRYLIPFVLSLVVLRAAPAGPAVWMGMSPTELVGRLGEPASSVSAPGRRILIYADGARFEFKDDQLVLVSGFKGQTDLEPPRAGETAPASPAPARVKALPPSTRVPTPMGATAPKPRESLAAEIARRGVPTFAPVEDRALPALRRATNLANLAFAPQLFDPQGRFAPAPLLLVASLFRMALTMLALRFTIRRLGRDLSWFDTVFLASIELLTRVAFASFGQLVLGWNLPVLILELATTVALAGAACTRPEIRRPWLALRIVLVTKLISFAVLAACLISLVDAGR